MAAYGGPTKWDSEGYLVGLNPSTGNWERLYGNTEPDWSFGDSQPDGNVSATPYSFTPTGVPGGDIPIMGKGQEAKTLFEKYAPGIIKGLAGVGLGYGAGSALGLFGAAAPAGSAAMSAADAGTLAGLTEGGGAAAGAEAAAAGTGIGSGLAVDEFGNVIGAGAAGGGGTGIGSGMAVDAFGNVTGGSAAGTGTTGAAAGGGTAISRILNGTGTSADYLSVLGSAAPAALGAYASTQQTGALQGLANQYMSLGAPSRARYEASFAPGFSMSSDPGYQDALDQSAKGTLHALSTQGNPAGSPNAWAASLNDLYAKTAYPALQNYRSGNASAGGLQALTAAAPSTATAAIGSNANFYNAIGGGIADVFNPPKTLSDLLKGIRYA